MNELFERYPFLRVLSKCTHLDYSSLLVPQGPLSASLGQFDSIHRCHSIVYQIHKDARIPLRAQLCRSLQPAFLKAEAVQALQELESSLPDDTAIVAYAGTVETLLASGAKSDAVDPNGMRPLHLVAQGGAQRINASRAISNRGHNLMKLLYGWEYTLIVKVLLSNGASLDVEDKTGKRPIDYASEGGFSEMVDLLLAAGANPPR